MDDHPIILTFDYKHVGKASFKYAWVLDEGDDADVDRQQSCGHEQLGPSVTKESSLSPRNP